METKSKFNRSQIMSKAWSLKKAMGYDTFSQALKHSWLVAKNEVVEKEQQEKQAVIHARWKSEHQEKEQLKNKAEREEFLKSGLDFHTYTMKKYYNGYGYKGD